MRLQQVVIGQRRTHGLSIRVPVLLGSQRHLTQTIEHDQGRDGRAGVGHEGGVRQEEQDLEKDWTGLTDARRLRLDHGDELRLGSTEESGLFPTTMRRLKDREEKGQSRNSRVFF